jgi:hypothetical protein
VCRVTLLLKAFSHSVAAVVLLLFTCILQEAGKKAEDFVCGRYTGDELQSESILVSGSNATGHFVFPESVVYMFGGNQKLLVLLLCAHMFGTELSAMLVACTCTTCR